jgi:hypothetical protein
MRKGQAALEFLMTYGWAILVVLAAIAALAFFGVLNPGRFLPEKCTMPSGLACLDFQVVSGQLTLIVQNSFGFDINNVAVTLSNGTGCAQSTNMTGAGSLTNGAKATYTLGLNASTACQPSSGKFRVNVNMNYVNQDTNLAHTKTGELIVQVP